MAKPVTYGIENIHFLFRGEDFTNVYKEDPVIDDPVDTLSIIENKDGTFTVSGVGVIHVAADTYQITDDSIIDLGMGRYSIKST